jgi:SAM-dependent MidA family methyltransferase
MPRYTFRDFVDDALFHPRWGYYSTGQVRFGEGGHYETFPLALSPIFAQLVVRCAYRFWMRSGRPNDFELCEIGAGNGQLCLDALSYLHGTLSGATRPRTPAWERFARLVRYHIVERSPALIRRQRAQLGPLAAHVGWTRADLSVRPARGTPFARYGFIIANEVLDCLAHEKIVVTADGPGVVTVEARAHGRTLSRDTLAGAMTGPERERVEFLECSLPLQAVAGLPAFIRRHCPELLNRRASARAYFACPAIAALIANSTRLYESCEAFWIDYGEERPFHLRTPDRRRIFAGPPRSRRSVYDRPGRDDITFMVDFTVAQNAARDAGVRVVSYGPQSDLVRYARVRLNARSADLIARARAVGWMLALSGKGPEHAWHRSGLTWKRSAARGGSVKAGVQRSIDELLGLRPSPFKLLVLRSGRARRGRRGR